MAKKKNTQRADGRYAVQVYLGLGDDGKRKYKTVYGATQKEADEKALQIKISMRKGLDIASERDTFADWARRWLDIKSGEVGYSQNESYSHVVDVLNERIGDAPISKIKSIDIQGIINDLARENPETGKPSAPRTLRYYQQTASQVFRLAADNRAVDYNPADAVKIPKTETNSDRRALTEAEQRWIVEMDHRAKTAAMIMMYAGLRRGELIPLMWSDIDLETRTISVNKAVATVKSRFVIKETGKTAGSLRTIDMPKVLVDYLAAQPRRSLYVCTSAKGFMHTDSSWRRMWNSYLNDMNFKYGDFSCFLKKPSSKYEPGGVPFVIPRITAHWLRHTYATLLYFAGIDVMTAKEQLGHASITTTLEIYTHLNHKHKRREMDKLDAFLSGASQMQVSDEAEAQ